MSKAEEAVELAKQAQNLGFVEFTTDLISGVYEALVDAQMKQGKGFAELLSSVSKSVSEYQLDVSGLTFEGKNHTDAANTDRLDEYIDDVLGLENSSGSYVIDDSNKPTLIDNFGGTATISDNSNPPKTETLDNKLSTVSDTTTVSLPEDEVRELVFNKVKSETNAQYELLREMVRIGFARLDTTGGFIETGLEFKIASLDTSSVNSRSTDIKSNSWYANASVNATFKKWGFSVNGGASGSRLQVDTTNKSDYSRINTNIKFTGKVHVDFATTVFDPVALGSN